MCNTTQQQDGGLGETLAIQNDTSSVYVSLLINQKFNIKISYKLTKLLPLV